MGTELKYTSNPEDKRRAGRVRLEIDCALRERGSTTTAARLADFSRFGCRVQGVPVAGREGQVWVKLPSLESRAARVVWRAGGEFGLEFESPIHPDIAARFLPAKGSHAALAAANDPEARDEPASRREQILRGLSCAEHSPLQRRKQPNGLGMFGKITRMVPRSSDHRLEQRYSDAVCQNGKLLSVAGVPARIVDVSASGLRVRAVAELDIGDVLTVEFAGFPPLLGQLVWMKADQFGIALPPQSIDLHTE